MHNTVQQNSATSLLSIDKRASWAYAELRKKTVVLIDKYMS